MARHERHPPGGEVLDVRNDWQADGLAPTQAMVDTHSLMALIRASSDNDDADVLVSLLPLITLKG